MNNVYLVLSEELHYQVSGCYDPHEWYCIFELVVAKSTAQAKYLASDRPMDIRDRPKFRTELKLRNVPFEPQVLPNNPATFLGLDESLNNWLFAWREEYLNYDYHKSAKEAYEEIQTMLEEE